MKKGSVQTGLMIGMLLAVFACAPAQNVTNVKEDPYEPFNRQVFAFNEVVDTLVLSPVARTYRYIVPECGRKAVHNALRNLTEPVIMFNALLQFDDQRAFTALWRFLINSTLGFGGLYDFAGENTDLQYRKEDFGQTLAVWGNNDDSSYLVLPIIGPSTARDTVGLVADGFMTPWVWMLETDETLALTGAYIVSERERSIETLDHVYKTSFDPYTTIRSGYLQRRKALIHNSHNPENPEQ